MFPSVPPAPAPPPIPDPPPNPPQFGSENSRNAGNRASKPGMGYGGTILGGDFSSPANTSRKTLLGQ